MHRRTGRLCAYASPSWRRRAHRKWRREVEELLKAQKELSMGFSSRKRRPKPYIFVQAVNAEAIRFRGDQTVRHSPAIRKALRRRLPPFSLLLGLRLIYAMFRFIREDRLGRLPDDILLSILDRLNAREAARAGVLARRWQHLPAMLSCLTIDVRDFLPKPATPTTCNDEEIDQGNAAVVEATKSILAPRVSSPNTIRSMSMAFFLREDDSISIGHAVGQIMATHKTAIIEFTVCTERSRNDDDLIDYGRRFMLFFGACPIAFGGLTRLCLENLILDESDIPNVLITCRRLKHLSLSKCGSESDTILQVEHTQLSELVILNCFFQRVELNSLPKLTSMIFAGWVSVQDPLLLGHVPLLEDVILINIHLRWKNMIKLSKILGGASLRKLTLGFQCEKIWVEPEPVTKRLASLFRQLRFLNLDNIPEGCDLIWTFFILEAAPNLKELYLTVWDHLYIMQTDEERRAHSYDEKKGVEWRSPASDFQHHSLATLVISGFQSDCMVRYVRRVMEAAVNLKDVFLYHRRICKKCCISYSNRPLKFPSNEEEKSTVLKKLTRRINSSATIHIPWLAIKI